MPTAIVLRPYESADLDGILALFEHTVMTVNRRDYSQAACRAWADAVLERERWAKRLEAHQTWVAVQNERIVGFGDIDGSLLDHLFVAADRTRQGIGAMLCEKLELLADGPVVSTFASKTARPFFEARGYVVVRAQTVCVRGELLENFRMEKRLA